MSNGIFSVQAHWRKIRIAFSNFHGVVTGDRNMLKEEINVEKNFYVENGRIYAVF